MNTAERVIELLGGARALARELGHKHPTTVQSWKESGVIPAQRMRDVLAVAERLGKPLTADDLIPQAPEPERKAS